LNIAEGCGRSGAADSSRFFSIARGSAMECGAILDALEAVGVSQTAIHEEAAPLVVRMVEMLSKMCR
jgi:four helix bundle protein